MIDLPPNTLSRRDLLKAALMTLGGSMMAQGVVAADRPDAAGAENIKAGWIDAHSHIWTRDVEKFPLAAGQTVDDLAPPSFTAEELLKLAATEGVTRAVLIQHHIYHGWDNSYLIDAARRYPERFRVVGMVDDTQPHPDALMRTLLPQQVTGFRITPRIRGAKQWLDGPGMAAMWQCAADTGQAMCCLIDAADLPAVDAMCRRFPETPVVIDHLSRIGVDGRVREADVKALCDLSKHASTTVKVSAFYALGKMTPPYRDLAPLIRRVFDAYGPERLMWASDSPYQVVGGHTYAASIDLVRSGLDFLSPSDRQWLLRKTAEKVFGFGA
jgi:predicted TIM-barrel fold metal-dependent hydrolase